MLSRFSLLLLVVLMPFAAQAESNLSATGSSASAKLDFSVVIPKVLFLQIGTGTGMTNNTAVDQIAFTVPAASIANGVAVTGTGGNLINGAVTVRVLGNVGNVNLGNTVSGPLRNAAGATTISWNDIKVVASAPTSPATGYTALAIAHPPFNTGVGGGNTATKTTLNATNGVIRNEAVWTFSYANTTTAVAGTYGTAANNGRVTYTASTP